MLRILLIILVALAVIIGLMRLTGRSGGDTPAPTIGAAEEPGDLSAPIEPMTADEPVDALDDDATIDGAAGTDVLDPELTTLPDPALDAIDDVPAVIDDAVDSVTVDPAPPAGENAVAAPASAPVIDEPAPEPEAPSPPGR